MEFNLVACTGQKSQKTQYYSICILIFPTCSVISQSFYPYPPHPHTPHSQWFRPIRLGQCILFWYSGGSEKPPPFWINIRFRLTWEILILLLGTRPPITLLYHLPDPPWPPGWSFVFIFSPYSLFPKMRWSHALPRP